MKSRQNLLNFQVVDVDSCKIFVFSEMASSELRNVENELVMRIRSSIEQINWSPNCTAFLVNNSDIAIVPGAEIEKNL